MGHLTWLMRFVMPFILLRLNMHIIKSGSLYVLEDSTRLEFRSATNPSGTINEELLEILLDRLVYLQSEWPCDENVGAINGVQDALMSLWARQKRIDSQPKLEKVEEPEVPVKFNGHISDNFKVERIW